MAAPIENIIDPSTGLKTLWKNPNASKLFDIDCAGEMTDTDTLTGVGTAVSTSQSLVDGSSNVTISGETHDSSQKMQMRIAGGTDLEDYRIVLTGTTTAGDTVVAEVMLRVRSNPAEV